MTTATRLDRSPAPLDARRLAAHAALGAVVGTLGDRIHTYWHVLAYPRPTAWDEAWWVVPLMGGAGIAMIGGHGTMQRAVREARGGGTGRDVAAAFAWFATAYLASGVLRAYPLALSVGFVASFVARALAPSRRASRALWLHAVGTALVGTLFESALSATGAFRYVVPDLLGNVPPWLPGLYLHAALLARAVDRRWPGR